MSATKTRQRRIWGRRLVTVDGVEYRVELRADALAVRRKHARGEWTLPLADLVNESLSQKTFRW